MGNIYDNIYDKIYTKFLSTQKVTRHCMTFLSNQVFLGEKSQVKAEMTPNFLDYTMAILGNWESNPKLWHGGAPNWQRYINFFFLLISLSQKKRPYCLQKNALLTQMFSLELLNLLHYHYCYEYILLQHYLKWDFFII